MQFISISRRLSERFSEEAFATHIEAERERVRELYKDGVVRSIWSRKDVAGAVMLLECPDEAAEGGGGLAPAGSTRNARSSDPAAGRLSGLFP
jgi:hypothetical protein